MIPAAAPQIGLEERAAVDAVLTSGNLAQGPEVEAFEEEFSATAVDRAFCVAVNSGTSALHLSLLAAGLAPGDEVIVPSFSFAATANSVALTGATPIFVDIEHDSFCIDPNSVLEAISPLTRAVIPVHLYGNPASMKQISDICSRYNLTLIEDAAQAHLASIDGRPVGTWGLAGTFSFYPTKNMTAGEGGMVTTFDDNFARTVRLLRNQGQEVRYRNEIIGLNNRMSDIHAAIGRVQLRKLLNWTALRQSNAAFYDANLSGVGIPRVAAGAIHVYHQYTIRVLDVDRDAFASELAKLGVGSGVYYPVPIHRLPAFTLELDLPETDLAASQVLSLPVHPSLSEKDRDLVVSAVNSVARAGVGSG